jgi:tight adherence protein B
MNPRSLEALSWAASVALSVGVVVSCVLLAKSAPVKERLARHHAQLATDLAYLQARVSPRRVLSTQVLLAASWLALAAASASLWPLQLLIPTVLGPTLWLRRQREARTGRIEAQLDGWLLALSNALHANPALGDSIAQSARLVGPPLSQELSLLHKECRLGMPLDRALRQLGARVRSPIVGAALATLRVARGTGGNLSETLAASAASLREMARLEGVVRAKTAEGRAQATMIGVLPAPLVLLLQHIDPQLLSPLWSTTRGHMVVAAACVLWVTALLWARRIVAVDI